jgi:hypothetical protein
VKQPSVEFLTTTDARYYVGTVALLNSLRLTGNDAPLAVLDLGMTTEQRSRLAPHARILPPSAVEFSPATKYSAKPRLAATSSADVVVLIDSDILVTSELSTELDEARRAKLVAAPDGPGSSMRSFREWEALFGLRAAVRSNQIYVNAGFVVFAPAHWPDLLSRWIETCDVVQLSDEERRARLYEEDLHPIAGQDQDALNALLMSEFPGSALHIVPYHCAPFPQHMSDVRVEDAGALRCVSHDERVTLLHYVMTPKPWQAWGWTRAGSQAYITLLPRTTVASDVALRLDERELPRWLTSPPLRHALGLVAPLARTAGRAGLRPLSPKVRMRLRRRIGRG